MTTTPISLLELVQEQNKYYWQHLIPTTNGNYDSFIEWHNTSIKELLQAQIKMLEHNSSEHGYMLAVKYQLELLHQTIDSIN